MASTLEIGKRINDVIPLELVEDAKPVKYQKYRVKYVLCGCEAVITRGSILKRAHQEPGKCGACGPFAGLLAGRNIQRNERVPGERVVMFGKSLITAAEINRQLAAVFR